MNQRYTDRRLAEIGAATKRSAATDPCDLILREMRQHFTKMSKSVDSYDQHPLWHLEWDDYLELWRGHWRDRSRLNLVICRNDNALPYRKGNVRIDTRANQVKQQWCDYRKRLNRPGPHALV